MNGKRFKGTVALLGLACAFGFARTLSAQEATSSSECVKCHTDLEKMDEYSAVSAGKAAAIAG